MKSVFFSVIIPTYNQANLLKKALTSVLNQSFKSYEIIIIDNFSTDNTQEVVENIKDRNIFYKKIHNDGVIAKSRNEGIKLSNGEWLAFLDSDDSWYSKRLEIISNFLKKNNDYEIICTDELWPIHKYFLQVFIRKGKLGFDIRFNCKKKFFNGKKNIV